MVFRGELNLDWKVITDDLREITRCSAHFGIRYFVLSRYCSKLSSDFRRSRGMTFLCSSDRAETAESYCLGRLSGLEAEMFEEHFVACQECAAEVERAEIFIRAIRAAGMELYGRPTNLIQ